MVDLPKVSRYGVSVDRAISEFENWALAMGAQSPPEVNSALLDRIVGKRRGSQSRDGGRGRDGDRGHDGGRGRDAYGGRGHDGGRGREGGYGNQRRRNSW